MEENNKMNISRRGFLKATALDWIRFLHLKRSNPKHLVLTMSLHVLESIGYWVQARRLSKYRHSVSV